MVENGTTNKGIRNNSAISSTQTKTTAKLLNENEASLHDEVSDVKIFYRHIYFDAIDRVTNCIKTRFSPGHRAVKNVEQLILNVINGLEY